MGYIAQATVLGGKNWAVARMVASPIIEGTE